MSDQVHTRRTVLSASIGALVSGLGVSSAAACSSDSGSTTPDEKATDADPSGQEIEDNGVADFCPHCQGANHGCPACQGKIETCPHCRGQQDGCRNCDH